MASSGGRADGWPEVRLDQLWDLFMEWVEREAREGRAAEVVIPAFGANVGQGKRLAELTADEIVELAACAASVQRDARRLDMLWGRAKLTQVHPTGRRIP